MLGSPPPTSPSPVRELPATPEALRHSALSQKSARTRRAYRLDVQHLMRTQQRSPTSLKNKSGWTSTTVIGGRLHRGFVQSASAIVAIDPGRCRVSTLRVPVRKVRIHLPPARSRQRTLWLPGVSYAGGTQSSNPLCSSRESRANLIRAETWREPAARFTNPNRGNAGRMFEAARPAGQPYSSKSLRRFGAKPDKKIVDRQAASPSSWKTPCIATRMAW
jgi:hypothetical protein